MSEATKDGGPAFPRDHQHDGHNGMTLRDYFAAKAMPMARDVYCDGAPEGWLSVAKLAYDMADAMLKAREAQ
jgi:hypothetical protein